MFGGALSGLLRRSSIHDRHTRDVDIKFLLCIASFFEHRWHCNFDDTALPRRLLRLQEALCHITKPPQRLTAVVRSRVQIHGRHPDSVLADNEITWNPPAWSSDLMTPLSCAREPLDNPGNERKCYLSQLVQTPIAGVSLAHHSCRWCHRITVHYCSSRCGNCSSCRIVALPAVRRCSRRWALSLVMNR